MAIYAVFLIAVCLSATSAVHKPCGVGQCKLVLVGQNPAVKFQQLASEEGVRLVYFNLEIGNSSVHPLESEERLLAKRWIWAKTTQEPMLRLTDNEYDIYSLGLLTRQKRYMSVQLEEKPPRCLAELNISCQDNVVAEALLGNITNLNPGNRLPQTGSVCTYHKKNSPSQREGWKFLCCSLQNNTEGNHTIVRCGLALGNVWSAKLFLGVYYLLMFTLWLYAPAIPLLIPDWLFNVQHERDKENKKEQPVSDLLVAPKQVSPIEQQGIEMTDFAQTSQQTVGQFIEAMIDAECSDSSKETDSKLEENFSTHHKYHELSNEIHVEDDNLFISAQLRGYVAELTQMNFNLKLFFFIFVVFPIFLHLKLAVAFFYNLEYYQEVSRKSHQHCADDGQLFAICLSTFVDFGRQWKLTFLGTTALFSFVLLLVVIPFIRPKDLLPPLGPLIFGQLKKQRQYVLNFTFYMLVVYMDLLKKSVMKFSLSGRTGKSRRRRASRFMCDFLSIFPKFLIGATLSFASILIFLIGLFAIFALFSPFTSFFIFTLLKKLMIIYKSIVIAGGSRFIHFLIPFVLSCTTLAIFFISLVAVLRASVAFIMTIFFLTIVGLVLNYEFVSPYVVFISVVAANIYLCYSNLLSRYREVKGMILKHWEEETKDLPWMKCRNDGTIPDVLFWSVCGHEWGFEESEMQIFPLTTEIFFMFRDMALVVFFLCLFFFAVIAFETVEEISALVSTFFVFISGVIPTLIFKRFTTKKKFSAWDKIKIDNKIKEAVREYVLFRMEEIPYSYEVSEPPTAWA